MLTLKRYSALRRGRKRLPGACLRAVAAGARVLGDDEVARVGRCTGSERSAGHAHEVEPARVRVSAGESKRQSVASVARRPTDSALRAPVRPTECSSARDVALSGHIDRNYPASANRRRQHGHSSSCPRSGDSGFRCRQAVLAPGTDRVQKGVRGVQNGRPGHGLRRPVPSKRPGFHACLARRAPGKPLLHGKMTTEESAKKSTSNLQDRPQDLIG